MRSPTKIRSELATTVRYDPDNTAAIDRLRAEHRASRADEYIRRLIAAAPPLSEQQRAELAALLTSAADLDASGLLDAGEQ